MQEIRAGVIAHEDANVDINRIQMGVLNLLRNIEDRLSPNEETNQATNTERVNSSVLELLKIIEQHLAVQGDLLV